MPQSTGSTSGRRCRKPCENRRSAEFERFLESDNPPEVTVRHSPPGTVVVREIVALSGGPEGAFVANGKFMAALGAAPRENGPSVLGFHARPETMSLGPFAVVGLECTFRHFGSHRNGSTRFVARPCTRILEVGLLGRTFSIHEAVP